MRFAGLGILVLLALTACDAGPSAVMADGEGKSASDKVKPAAAPVWAQENAKTASSSTASDADIAEASMPIVSAEAPSDQPPVSLPAGTGAVITETTYGDWPLWSVSRKYSADNNAHYQFDHHGAEIGATSYADFVAKVHGFIHAPPSGTQTLKRGNGDTLFYDAKDNIFAVMTKQGAPRILMRPDDGAAYWQEQKVIEASRSKRGEGDG